MEINGALKSEENIFSLQSTNDLTHCKRITAQTNAEAPDIETKLQRIIFKTYDRRSIALLPWPL
jgi:hypothetical protein